MRAAHEAPPRHAASLTACARVGSLAALVLAGHNGESTSELLSRRLHHNLVADENFDKDVVAALVAACEKTDEECQDMNVRRCWRCSGRLRW